MAPDSKDQANRNTAKGLIAMQLTLTDRFWRAMARYVDRTALRLIPSQPILRKLFSMTAPLGAALPKGASVTKQADGSLHILPAGVAPDAPVLLYLHGGGFTIGSPQTHAALVAHLAAACGLRAVVPKYRLAPEHPFPAAKQDAIAAFDALVQAGTPPVAICGDSAGGCLALQVACHARDRNAPTPKALGLLAPIADLSGEVEARFAEAEDEILIPPSWPERIKDVYLPGMDRDSAAISPLSGDLSNLPPTLIQAATGEALAQDAKRLLDAMDDATLDLWPGLPHVWQLHAGRTPAADAAIAKMGAFLAAKVA
ncbi:alpha/beta hydrolase [Gymnodinialimonas sp. 57CJ19]|uniref:alpha/beta hydrolase n=1 Tax=Gymnodinialimonas sp. 57CJ19 TaxID=3138498 RepID=UPI0031345A7D